MLNNSRSKKQKATTSNSKCFSSSQRIATQSKQLEARKQDHFHHFKTPTPSTCTMQSPKGSQDRGRAFSKDKLAEGSEELGIPSQPSFNDKLDYQNPTKSESYHFTQTPVFRMAVLVLLCIQNSGLTLLTRYSRGILKEKYSATEVVFVGEIIKLLCSGYFVLYSTDDANLQLGHGFKKLFGLLRHSRPIIVLVVLYSIGNVLTYFALGRVDATVYTVLTQLKILTTASFSMILLGRQLSSTKWRALLLLIIGCILVASPSFSKALLCSCLPELHKEEERKDIFRNLVGIAAVLLMCTISGYSSVYFEGMLKKSSVEIGVWHRNFQLAFFSAIFLLGVMSYEFMSSNDKSHFPLMFEGWTINAVAVTLVQSGGGLLVAATLKFADSILKTLATSGAIFLSAVLGKILLGGQLDIFVALGGLSTVIAIFNYSFDASV